MQNSNLKKSIITTFMAFAMANPYQWQPLPPVSSDGSLGHSSVSLVKRGCAFGSVYCPNPPAPGCSWWEFWCGYNPQPEPPRVACPLVAAPVCGSNGITYDNSCFAELQNVPVAHNGQCRGVSPANPPQQPPTNCTLEYSPVCGVDGRTYGNACSATVINRVQIAYPGACQEPQIFDPFPNIQPQLNIECDPHLGACIPILRG